MTGGFSKITQYFDTMLTAKAPDKFTAKFMSDLGFTSSNDRQFVNVLKAIGFLDDAGNPTSRYFSFLDQSNSKKVVAEGIREAYKDLFNLNIKAYSLSKDEVVGKFATLTNGSKEKSTLSQMANTFVELCKYADWTSASNMKKQLSVELPEENENISPMNKQNIENDSYKKVNLSYDIHIHLPATRDQAVYDALFTSLSKHIII